MEVKDRVMDYSSDIWTFTQHDVKKVSIYKVVAKRVLDVFVSIIGIIFLIPMMLVLWIANFISKDNGPIFYTQDRIGRDGKYFKLYKFRSMVVGADEKLSKYLAENEEARKEYRKYKKLKDDPRITPIGKLIRKTSIDEFPQFINVLKGDMSVIGPRPYLPREKDDMKDAYYYVITRKPGLTGLWQVSGRSDVDFENRLKLDIEYIEKESFTYDFKLFLKTIVNTFKRNGAI